MKRIDVTGKRFGRLVGVRPASLPGAKVTLWLFRCDCGAEATVRLGNITNGHTTSCGCARSTAAVSRSVTHGHERNRRASRTLKSYRHAKSRCFNPNDAKFPDYGGRGITMCEAWRNDFAAFLKDMGECPPGTTLERIETNGNYEPGNCRWATPWEQNRNKRSNIIVEDIFGRQLILRDFAREQAVRYGSLYSRIRRTGESPQAAALHLRSLPTA